MSHKYTQDILRATVVSYRRRFFVMCGIVVMLVCICVGYVVYQRVSPGISFYNPFPLIDPARSIVAQEHFFSTIEPLRQELRYMVHDYETQGYEIGLYFEFLNTGANISINQDARFWPASLTKMPSAIAVMKKIEKGEWKLSNELVLFAEDKDDRFGDLYKHSVGTRFTIEELLKKTMIDSDNTSHSILVRNLATTDYTDMLSALGIENLFDQEYDITAKEYSRIFRALYNASYLNRAYSQQILTWLSQTRFEQFLDKSLPQDVVFSHKIGIEKIQGVFLDSGIVYVPFRPYLITVMIKVPPSSSDPEGDAGTIMQQIAVSAYQFVSSYE